MSKYFSLKRFSPFLAFLLALLLVVITAGAAYAILGNNKISGEMVEGGDVWMEYLVSPDGQYTLFLADAITDDRTELFSVRTLGGERVLLSQGLPADCHVWTFSLSTDGQHVVYSAIDSSFHHCGLFTVPIDGGEPLVLDPANENYSAVRSEVTGDNEKVVFVLRTSTSPFQSRLYYVPLAGGTRQPISEVVNATIHFLIDPSSAYVVYLQIASSESDKLYKNNFDDFNVLLDQDDSLSDFQITPDGLHVVYRKTTTHGIELYSVSIGGDTPKRLNESMTMGGMVESDYEISPNSIYVVYRSDQEVIGTIKLYQVPVDGSTSPVSLTPVLTSGGNVTDFKITPTKLGDLFYGVVYMADQLVDDCIDLFSVRIDGGLNIHLSTGMTVNGNVDEFKITPYSLFVVYIADGDSDEVAELYAVDIIGSTSPEKINDPLPTGGNVTFFEISHNGKFVIYHADQEVDEEYNLYVFLSATSTVNRINPMEMVPGGDVLSYGLITPDDKGVVYIADQETDDVLELFVSYDFQPPMGIDLSSTTVDENQPINTIVGTLSTTDPDIGDSFSYALVPGDGDEDNESFNISGDQLRTSQVFDYETKDSYSIRVQVIDQGGLTFESEFVITINDLSEDSKLYLPLVKN